MKFSIQTIGLSMIALALSMSSCKKQEGCTDPSAVNYDPDADHDCCCEYAATSEVVLNETYYYVPTNITGTTTLPASQKHMLKGGVFVRNGGRLIIEAGAEVFADDGATTPFLAVQRGGMIDAQGTAMDPIVFTTIKTVTGGAAAGDWGGIIINGRGILNVGGTAEGEGGTGTYGGSDNLDDSGVMRYVRVEYGGRILGTDNELNGFSFNAVGSGTTLEYLQAYKGADDGFEFFGGAARLKYAVSTGNSDDSFDWTHGWQGKGQFWVVHQSSSSGDRGFEGDNWEDNYLATPTSNPTICNFTLVGSDDGDASNTGARLRHGTKGALYNGLVTAFPSNGIRASDSSATFLDNGELIVKYTTSFGNGSNWANSSLEIDPTNSSTDPGVLSGYVGVDPTNAADPTSLDPWFSAAPYRGAVDATNDWTIGWARAL